MTTSDSPVPALTGIILAGGQSTRFGADKASAIVAGRPMLQWVMSALAAACTNLIVVSASGQSLPEATAPVPVRYLVDRTPSGGPLVGLATGMAACESDYCFATSCDSPLMQPALIRLLAREIGANDVACPRVGGYLQPVVALYRVAACRPAFDDSIRSQRLGLTAALAALHVRVVTEDRIRSVDPLLDSFVNANTPALLPQIEARLRARYPEAFSSP